MSGGKTRDIVNGLNMSKMKISDLGEWGLINLIDKKIKIKDKSVIKGIGDDTAVLKFDKKNYMLFTTDSLVEKDHFDLKWISPEQIGKKSIESNVSDIASMGGFPKYALVSLSVPKNTKVNFIKELYDGINKAAKKYNLSIVGGNLSRSKQINVHVSLIGFVEKERLCLRSHAKVGDLICVTGKIRKTAKSSSVRNYLKPTAKLKQARLLSKAGVNAMQDVSDGLGSEIKAICDESKTGAFIFKERLPKITKKNSMNLDKWAPYVDYLELVFTIPKNKLKKIRKSKTIFSIIGEIKNKKQGIFLIDKNKKTKLKSGYDHFLNS